MAYATSNILGVDPTATYTVSASVPEVPAAPFAVGTVCRGTDGTEFVFVQNNSSSTALVVGDVVYLTTAWKAAQLSTANDARGFLAGVAVSAIPASGYGWVQRAGICAAISVLASAAANTRLNTTGTAGALDDDGTSTAMQVQGIYLTTARGGTAGTAAGVLNLPFVDATL